jgi:hypothetical protein
MPIIVPLLTLLGLVPLIALAFGAVGNVPVTAAVMLVALIDYAALVLAFAGGVHWGLAMQPETPRPTLRFTAALLPMFVGMAALFLAQMQVPFAPWAALAVLIVGYLATVMTEHRAAKRLLVPARYVWMRWGFSFVAVVMMVMVLVLRGVGQTIVF